MSLPSPFNPDGEVDVLSVIELPVCGGCGEPYVAHTHDGKPSPLVVRRLVSADAYQGAVAENKRLRAFAFGDAPEWEKANATLKHRVRELEAELAELRGQ